MPARLLARQVCCPKILRIVEWCRGCRCDHGPGDPRANAFSNRCARWIFQAMEICDGSAVCEARQDQDDCPVHRSPDGLMPGSVPDFVKAMKDTGHKQLIIAGVITNLRRLFGATPSEGGNFALRPHLQRS